MELRYGRMLAVGSIAAAVLAGSFAPAEAGKRCNGSTTVAVNYRAAEAAPKDIVDTAVSAGSFKTLAAALEAAGLVDALKGKGPFTVFAPTDEAFAKLPEGTVEGLLKDKEKLQAVLKYHVVAGKVTAGDVVKLDSAETLQGGDVRIDASDGVKINDSKVTKADIMCKNGVIHVIDSVLIPE